MGSIVESMEMKYEEGDHFQTHWNNQESNFG